MDFWNSGDVYSDGLGSGAVYYQRLADDGEEVPRLKGLYKHVTGIMGDLEVGIRNSPTSLSSELRGQAAAERSKELQAINRAWGIQLDDTYLQNKNFYRDLIEAINIKLSSQKIFQRNRERLLYTGKTGQSKGTGKIDISKFFGSYFPKAFNENREHLASRVASRAHGVTIEDAARQVLEEEMPEILRSALIEMYSSDTFNANWENVGNNKAINQQTQGAYQEIVDGLMQFGNARDNPFLDAVWRTYNFDELINELVKNFSEKKQNFKKRDFDKNGVITKVTARQTTAGVLAELQATLVAQLANQMNGDTFQVMHTGAMNNQKSDFTVGYQVDLGNFFEEQRRQMYEARELTDSTRAENILATGQATQWMMENATDYEFIGYVNQKNYDLGKDFKGFSSGAAISLATFEEVANQIPTMSELASQNLIGALMQFGDGAVGTDAQREVILQSLASAMAYFLFDDFTTISLSNNPTGFNAIHLFQLSGLFIPLSYLLEVSADAIDLGWERTNAIFKFSLNSPGIIYGDIPLEDYTHDMWVEQGEYALYHTTLTFTFLSSFQELMTQVL